MSQLNLKQNPAVGAKFNAYPSGVKEKLEHLRALVLEVAEGIDGIGELEETLKWGEPSYLAKKGSTLRMDWKQRAPKQYAMYFSCSTSIVETIRAVYGDLFTYEKNRALLFDLDAPVPEEELKQCITMALQYHRLKHKPFLGYLG